MQKLLQKNLLLHRKNNSKTSIIYSLTIGSVILLFVTLAIQIDVIVLLLFPYGQIDLAVAHIYD